MREAELRRARYRVAIHTTLGTIERTWGPDSPARDLRSVCDLARIVVDGCGRELKRRQHDVADQRPDGVCEMCDAPFEGVGPQKRCYPCIAQIPTRLWCQWKHVGGIEYARQKAVEDGRKEGSA